MKTIQTLVNNWFWLHLVSIAALLIQRSTPATILNRYSTTAITSIAIFLVLLPLNYIGSRWLRQGLDAGRFALSWALSIVVCLLVTMLLFMLWFINVGPTVSYLVVKVYFSVILITIGLWAALYLPGLPNIVIANVGKVAVICFALLAVVLSRQFPGLLWTDEGIGIDIAQSWVQHGRLAIPFYLSIPYGSVYSIIEYGLGVWFGLFGTSLEAGRLFMLLVGFAAVTLITLTARILYSRRVAVLVAILALCAMFALNYIRIDIGASFYIAVAFYCYARAEKKNQVWLHLLVGFATGWGLDGHPNAYRFVIAFGLAYLSEYALLLWQRRRIFVYRPFIYLVVGQLVGLAVYIGFYSLIAHDAFLGNVKSPALYPNLANATGLFLTQIVLGFQNMPLLFGAALLGLVIAVKRHTPTDRLLIIVLLVSMVVLATFNGYVRNFYLLHSLALFGLLAGALFWELEQRFKLELSPLKLESLFAGLVVLLSGASLGWLVLTVRSTGGQSYEEARTVANQIVEIVPKQETFIGIDPFFTVMYDYPSFVEINAEILLQRQNNLTDEQAWDKIGATSVAIVSGYPIAPPASLRDYVTRHNFQRVRCWTSQKLGQVELFMQQIPAGVTPIDDCQPIS